MVLWIVAAWFGNLFAATIVYLFITPFIFEFFNAFESAGYTQYQWVSNMFVGLWHFFIVIWVLMATMWAFSAAQRKEYFYEEEMR